METNRLIAAFLRQYADLIEQGQAESFRVDAFRRAAGTVESLDRDVRGIVDSEGMEGLVALPWIGRGIAGAIVEILTTGRWSRLERLRGELDPVRLFQTVPGVGPELAGRIHEHLQVETLEALETAAHDGRLEQVPGVGDRRAAAVRNALEVMLGRRRLRAARRPGEPPVDLLLDVDREYRERAGQGRLRRIAPKRFNPEGKAWLPVLHTARGDWHFTALYSNTARAHELGRTGDWVVVYFYDGDHQEGQHTVVTETTGKLRGQRVVRGRERECLALAGGEP